MMASSRGGGVAVAVVGCGRTLTAIDIGLCLIPIGLFLSVVSLV